MPRGANEDEPIRNADRQLALDDKILEALSSAKDGLTIQEIVERAHLAPAGADKNAREAARRGANRALENLARHRKAYRLIVRDGAEAKHEPFYERTAWGRELVRRGGAHVWYKGIGEAEERRLDEYLSWIYLRSVATQLPPSIAATISQQAQRCETWLQELAKREYVEPRNRHLADQIGWRDRYRVLPGAFELQPPKLDAETAQELQWAVFNNRQINVIYRARDGKVEKEKRHMHPLAYLKVGHTGYVVLWSGLAEDKPMLHAIQRFRRVEALHDAPASMPYGFTLTSFLSSPSAAFVGGEVRSFKARVHGWLVTVLSESPLAPNQTLELEDSPGEPVAVVTAQLPISWQFHHWILSVHEVMEVLEPADLREAVVERLRSAITRYEAGGADRNTG
ncbi:WYL domain-containing protein [Niveibacterium sp. SC-1]|uniref:helix-turn-helix transcriptional regulator n=1 Tax=Niveibacterium sp. SC-1 TaxID=3135646 RepID=UPI00311E0E93